MIGAGAGLLLAALVAFDIKGYQSWKALKAQVETLETQVQRASELATRESAAASFAGQKADEAARRAEAAAAGRAQAEELKQQAESGRAQAESGRVQAESAAQRAAEQTKQAQGEVTQMRQEREKELNRMQEALNSIVETRRTATGMTMILPDSVFRFGFDASDLTPKNRELLSRIAGILLVSKGYGLSVYGYTDDVGTAEYNQQLSLRRAKAVEEYLAQSGIAQTTINVKGYGKSNPLVPGVTAAARAKNRRVEIALTDSEIRYGGEEATVPR
jgi:outer membrane protein OmpA-like peptidoglycan-associated protein